MLITHFASDGEKKKKKKKYFNNFHVASAEIKTLE